MPQAGSSSTPAPLPGESCSPWKPHLSHHGAGMLTKCLAYARWIRALTPQVNLALLATSLTSLSVHTNPLCSGLPVCVCYPDPAAAVLPPWALLWHPACAASACVHHADENGCSSLTLLKRCADSLCSSVLCYRLTLWSYAPCLHCLPCHCGLACAAPHVAQTIDSQGVSLAEAQHAMHLFTSSDGQLDTGLHAQL